LGSPRSARNPGLRPAADLARGEITEKITQRLGPGRPGGHFLRRP